MRMFGFFVWADAAPHDISHTARIAKMVLVMLRAFDFGAVLMNSDG